VFVIGKPFQPRVM